MALLAQSFRAMLPQTNNQLRTSSNTRNQATIQDDRVVVQNVQGRQNQNQRYFARGNGTAGNSKVRRTLGKTTTLSAFSALGLRHGFIDIPAYFNDSPLFGLTRTTSRSESENPFFQSFTSPGAMLLSFMMSYESAMERQSYVLFAKPGFLDICVFKNREINVIPKQYILRRWTRDIIPPDLRRQKNRYGEKNVTIERLTNEANFLVDDTLFLLSKDEGKMGTYVENLKKLLDDVKADMPNPPSRDTGDVIEGIFSITKTNEIEVQNPTKAVNKGEHLKKGERLKSEREKAITAESLVSTEESLVILHMILYESYGI
ncbi:hypothetical protein Tco_0154591 [Tanacetum coccineum]